MEGLNKDLYSLMLDKAEGETAYKKVQSVKRNDYDILYQWFREVSGAGPQNRPDG